MPEEGRLGPTSTASASVMRLKLEVEEKKQAVRLLQRALVTSLSPPPSLLSRPHPADPHPHAGGRDH